jgi:hypothetical protein
MLTVPVHTVRIGHVAAPGDDTSQVRIGHVEAPKDDMWQVRIGHVAASGSDMCQADLALLTYSWTNPKVTRVTTGRVTRGTGDISS